MGDVVLESLREIDDVIDGQWRGFGEPGTWLDGPQRVTVVRAARVGAASPTVVPDSIEEVAALVSHRASTITADTIDAIETAGIDRVTYVEIVGIVSRVAAIDTFDRGIGRTPRALPDPADGTPSREIVPEARRRAGWVPTVGAIGPPTALTSVRREAAEQEALHDVLYLSYGGMADLDADRGLHRTQMELVAARVSLLNDCFF
ncbi:MAG: hypothetical protein AB7R77_16830 [Ilumatobacteraceae bacterium]